MNLMTTNLLVWFYGILELFLILPVGLYLGGKIMEVQHKKFRFSTCIWINFIAGLIAGLVVEFNQWAALGIFIVLLAIMIKKQFQVNNKTIAVMVAINVLIIVGLGYLQQRATQELLEMRIY